MEIEERLNALLSRCVWVKDASTALRLVPSLAADLPPLIGIPGGGVCLPIACGDEILNATAEVLAAIGESGLSRREPIHQADHETLRSDPLVPTLAGLMAETARPTLNNQAIPGLATAWATARLLGPEQWRGARERELQALRAALSDRSEVEQGSALASLTWSISGRIGAAGAMARQAGWPVRVSGLSLALLTNPLALTRPAGSMVSPEDFASAAAVLGIDIDGTMLTALLKAGAAAVTVSRARLSSGKARPIDLELAALLDNAPPDAALFTPGVGVRIPLMLGDLIDVSDLTSAGLSKSTAKSLLKYNTIRAIASVWSELQVGLLRWDLLSALIAVISPIRQQGGRWRVDSGMLPGGPWGLLAPQHERRPSTQIAVAVNLTYLRESTRKVATAQKLPILAGHVNREWSALAASAPVAMLHGGYGLAIFTDPLQALNFALEAHKKLSGLSQLDVGPLGEPIRLLDKATVSIGVAVGDIVGGFDGENVWLEGGTIARAVALCGSAPAEGSLDDPLGLRGAHLGPGGFHSSGVVLDGRAIAAVLKKVKVTQSALYVAGVGGLAAGLSDDFSVYPFQAWWEIPAGVIAVVGLTNQAGASEVLSMESSELTELHISDAMLARSRQAAPDISGDAQSGATVDPFSASDPFGDDENDLETDSFHRADAADEREEPSSGADPFADADPFTADVSELDAEPDAFGFEGAEDDDAEPDSFGFEGAQDDGEPTNDPFLAASLMQPSAGDDEPTIMATIPPLAPPPQPDPGSEIEDTDFSNDADTDDDEFQFSDDDDDAPAPPPPPPMLMDDEDDAVSNIAPPMVYDARDEETVDLDMMDEDLSYESEAEDVFLLKEDDEDEIIVAPGGFDLDDSDEDEEEDDDLYSDDAAEDMLAESGDGPIEISLPMMMDDDTESEPLPSIASPEDDFDDFSFEAAEEDETAGFGAASTASSADELGMGMDISFEEDDLTQGFALEESEDSEEEYSFEQEDDLSEEYTFEQEDDLSEEYSFEPDEPSEEFTIGAAAVSVPVPPMLIDDEPVELAISAEPESEEDGDEAGDDGDVVSDAFLKTDIAKIFKRYVVAQSDPGQYTFGLLDDRSLRDVHHYRCSDLTAAYQQFLQDKMAEGFMLQVHMTAELTGLETGPMDMLYLEKAYQAMMGGS